MNRMYSSRLILLAAVSASFAADRAAAQYAAQVISYDSGTTPAIEFGSGLPFDVKSAALGEPERFTGEGSSPGVVSTFNPPFRRNEIISIGRGGELTLRLSHFAIPEAGGPEIGVFTNAGLADTDFPNGLAGDPLETFGIDSADVAVSENGLDWVSLGTVEFDIPTNGYTDVTTPFASDAGDEPSDFQEPFAGTLSDFAGLPYFDAGGSGILDLLGGSGGGTWLDIAGTGLAKVGFVRFSVSEGGTTDNFELDAVSITHAAMGAETVPEPATFVLSGLAALLLAFGQRQTSPAAGAGRSGPAPATTTALTLG